MMDLFDTLTRSGLSEKAAKALSKIPHKQVQVDPRRPFREPGHDRDEVIFIQTGLLAKYKPDGSGRRQIVALRFPGEGILPAKGKAPYGIQAITKADLMVGQASDLEPILEEYPEIANFFYKLAERQQAIGYEWLVNCGRRDSMARVAHLLCETAERMKVDPAKEAMRNPFTQQQIADITGQTSVNVNRVFADLERQGVIRRDGRLVHFEEFDELRRIASFQPDYLS
ncbi:Crp/Fnr family transcriptional regulator [Sphingomicrobium nitratireducens]|uniref:Crp/Fnr family transcriptional regulator n=1 Tax=Sphingomicrobium nitratireducens TaxID=2964666 RepID=UPI00224061F3|nr:Crp/Fnr family transcriptional regulator [Sphingomicrobium nitratireducens]